MSSTRYLLSRQHACSNLQRFTGVHAASKSRHSTLYSDTLPAMIPVLLLGSAVFLGLQLLQLKLSHEKFMDESMDRVQALEAEIDALQQKRSTMSESAVANDSPDRKGSARWMWW
ncbi:hypothetical protein CPB84DRAFT_1758370 [Gymnopilus junonius]|uniref:Uncharacterized protein n=1 Tax=Gymnopilus junonius TaxID=109634 RepID=A0A9P5P298_GYMJU|nr:hypothetical protein CPB84DRAFT_1758370 [Gymnopilus junonius]